MWVESFWGDTKQWKTKFPYPKGVPFSDEEYLLPNSLLLFENPNLNEVPAQFCPPLSHHHTLLLTIFMLAAPLVYQYGLHSQLKLFHSNTPTLSSMLHQLKIKTLCIIDMYNSS